MTCKSVFVNFSCVAIILSVVVSLVSNSCLPETACGCALLCTVITAYCTGERVVCFCCRQ